MSEQTSTIDVTALGPTVAELVGEGKKFKTGEDLAKGKLESDRYISELETKLKEKESEVETKLDSLLSQLAQQNDKSADLNSQAETGIQHEDVNKGETTKPEDVKALVEQALNEQMGKQTRDGNLQMVESAMSSTFGDRAGEESQLRPVN